MKLFFASNTILTNAEYKRHGRAKCAQGIQLIRRFEVPLPAITAVLLSDVAQHFIESTLSFAVTRPDHPFRRLCRQGRSGIRLNRRETMISKSCDFNEFLNTINGWDYADILLAANDEATAAERRFYKMKSRRREPTETFQEYAVVLKDFIYWLRNGIKPSSIREFDFQEFQDVRDNWLNYHQGC